MYIGVLREILHTCVQACVPSWVGLGHGCGCGLAYHGVHESIYVMCQTYVHMHNHHCKLSPYHPLSSIWGVLYYLSDCFAAYRCRTSGQGGDSCPNLAIQSLLDPVIWFDISTQLINRLVLG